MQFEMQILQQQQQECIKIVGNCLILLFLRLTRKYVHVYLPFDDMTFL